VADEFQRPREAGRRGAVAAHADLDRVGHCSQRPPRAPALPFNRHSRKYPRRNPAPCRLSSTANSATGGLHVKRIVLLLISALCLAASAAAQDKYPSRPIKMLVPYAPGGAVDIVTRIVTEAMRQT